MCQPEDEYPRATVPEPVTESLVVHWRPTVQYHQRRLDVLAEFQAEGLLKEFQVTPEWVGIRTALTQAIVDEEQVTLAPRGPLLAGDALDILRSVARYVSPPAYRLTVAFQFLVPVGEQTYDEARASALRRLSLEAVGAFDFAMLIDGKAGMDDWHCEFGIVAHDEIEARLRRNVGRTRSFGGLVPPFVDVPKPESAVYLFADVIWHISWRTVQDETDDPLVAEVTDHIERVSSESLRVVSAVQGRLCPSSMQPVVKGTEL